MTYTFIADRGQRDRRASRPDRISMSAATKCRSSRRRNSSRSSSASRRSSTGQGRQMVGWGDIAPGTTSSVDDRPALAARGRARGGRQRSEVHRLASVEELPRPRSTTRRRCSDSTGQARSRCALPTNGIRSACCRRILRKPFWASRRHCGPRRSRRWKTSSTWRSPGCPRPRRSAGHRPRRDNGRISAAALAAHGPRWSALGINFYRSPQVPWQ